MRTLAALLISATLLSACATKVEGLLVKDDFTAPQIQRGGMVAGGVVAEPGKFDLLQSNNFSNAMVAAIQSERDYIKIGPPSLLINAAGKTQYAEIMDRFSTADLDEPTLTRVAAKLKGTRYLALAKIDANTTEKTGYETEARESKDKNGVVTREPGKVHRAHKRSLIVTMTIYDLQSKSVAFTGQVKKNRETTKDYEKNLVTGIMSLVNAVKDKSQEDVYPTPEAPQTRDVLQEAFAGFGQNLPKVD
jgi:hypothetical protein